MAGVLLFIDNSNIFISGKQYAEKVDGIQHKLAFRLNFENLLKLALAGRNLLGVYIVGSIPPEEKAVWEAVQNKFGITPELFERGSDTHGEQGTDQCLQVHMLRAVNDYPEPQIVVLMTGDGAGYDDGVGFHADLERMHSNGWGVEVLSWDHSCNKRLKKWASEVGEFIPLDSYYNSISFIQGYRNTVNLDLTKRPKSNIKKSPVQLAEEKARIEAQKQIQELQKKLKEFEDKEKKRQKYNKRFNNKK